MIEGIYKAYKDSSGICTDTRSIKQNNLFVALKGPSFNANDFVEQALKDGCSYAIADEPRESFKGRADIFIVPNALEALQMLATYHRTRLKIPIIALTGSNGKTTTKELMKAALNEQYSCYATAGNYNNHIGVPLSLLEINQKHEVAIIEMGANHRGEIKDLCSIADPDYGLITNIGLAHLEGFGSEEGIYIGKKELFDYIIANKGTLFINDDDPKVIKASESYEGTRYGSSNNADFSGISKLEDGFLKVEWSRSDVNEKQAILTRLSGAYNFSNVMAAICVARYFGVPNQKIKTGIEAYLPSNQRSQVIETSNGNRVIVDCYNANPSSIDAALTNLAGMTSKPTIAILGDMKELGEAAHKSHQEAVDKVVALGISDCLLIGAEFAKTNSTFRQFADTNQAMEHLEQNALSNHNILIKGSRSMKLESLLPFV